MYKLDLKALKRTKLTYFGERKFSQASYEEQVCAPMPGEEKFINVRQNALYVNVPAELRMLYQYPLLVKEQEYHLFRKFNYCKYRARKLLRKLNMRNVTEAAISEVEAWLQQASQVKHLLVSCNTRLVGNLAKKQYEYMQNPTLELLLAIISDGNVGLTRAVDYFNFTLGLKFSTYATWAIKDTISKGREQRTKHADRQLTGYEDLLHEQVDGCHDPAIDFSDREFLSKLVIRLEPRKREVIRRYYGLDELPSENLEKISVGMKLSKERVRQIKEESLADLRILAGAT